MKIKILIFIFSCICISMNAQSHLTFKGLPIVGDANDFALKLKDKGYTLLDCNDNICFLNGAFAGYDDVTIAVVGTPQTNTVYKVSVFFDKKESFSKLESQYYSLLKSYSNKYGIPEKSYDFFITPYYKGDGFELQALENDKCRYISFFTIDNGHITIEIAKMRSVMVTYEDLGGSLLYNKEKEMIVDNDI